MLEVVVVVRRVVIAALAALLLAFAPPASAQEACTRTWVGASGTGWNNANNWDPPGVPGADDIVCIGEGTTSTTVNVPGGVTVRAIRSGRPLSNSQPLTISDPSSTSEFTTLSTGSTFVAHGKLKAAQSFTFGGTATLNGDIESPVVTFTGTNVTLDAAVHAPTVTQTGGTLTLLRDIELASLTKTQGTLTGNVDIEVGTLAWSGGTISGAGTLTVKTSHEFAGTVFLGNGRNLVTEGTGTWDGSVTGTGDVTWTNRATVTVSTSGERNLNATVANGIRPVFRNVAGASVTWATINNNYNVAWALENDGVLAQTSDSGQVYLDYGTGVSSGAFRNVVFGASATAAAGTQFVLAEGVELQGVTVAGEVDLSAGITVDARDLTVASGIIRGPASTTLIVSGHFQAAYGDVGAGGMTVIQPAGATMDWTAAFKLLGRRFESAGTVTITGTGTSTVRNIAPRMVWENTGVINLVAGQLAVVGDVDEAARLINRGRIVKSATSAGTVRLLLFNDGVVELQRGQLVVDRFEQTPNGTLRFDIGGSSTTQYGRLSATTFLYSGRLESTLSGGFTPSAGDVFSVITASTRSGLFHSLGLTGVTLDDGGGNTISLAGAPVPGAKAAPSAAVVAPPVAPGAELGASAGGTSSTSATCRRPAPAHASRLAPLCLAGGRYQVAPGRWMKLGTAERGARIRVVGRSRGVAARVSGGVLRVRLKGARSGTLRYRIVGKDGRRSGVATVRVFVRS